MSPSAASGTRTPRYNEEGFTLGYVLGDLQMLVSDLEKQVRDLRAQVESGGKQGRYRKFLNWKAGLTVRLMNIADALSTLRYGDFWLQVERAIDRARKRDSELSAVSILFPLAHTVVAETTGLIDLRK